MNSVVGYKLVLLENENISVRFIDNQALDYAKRTWETEYFEQSEQLKTSVYKRLVL